MREPLTFSRADLQGDKADATFTKVVRTGAPITVAIGEAAFDFIRSQIRALQFTEPKTDRVDLYKRVMAAYPGACTIVFLGSSIGGEGYATNADAVSEYYEITEAA